MRTEKQMEGSCFPTAARGRRNPPCALLLLLEAAAAAVLLLRPAAAVHIVDTSSEDELHKAARQGFVVAGVRFPRLV